MKIQIAHILVQHKYQAEDLLSQIYKGKEFGILAFKYSQCASAKNYGNLGIIDIDKLDEDFSEVALALKSNEISSPVRTRFGYHLIMRLPLKE